MRHAAVRSPGAVRVTVASDSRRVDLVLPGAVPVAELVPELARSVGLLASGSAHGGYRLLATDGRSLAPELGLLAQGVEDGTWLTMVAGVDDEPPRVYDDVVEAMADAVERLPTWAPADARRTALAAALLMLALGLVAVLGQRDGIAAGSVAALTASALLSGAVAVSRVHREPVLAVALAWLGTTYAAVAGFVWGQSTVVAAATAAGAALGCLVALDVGRAMVLPPAVAAVVFLVSGVLVQVLGADPTLVPTAALVLVVAVSGGFPRAALGVVGVPAVPVAVVDAERVAADARLAHEILLGLSASVGLLLVVAGPLAVSRGAGGAALAVVCCALVLLRTRRHRTAPQVLAGLGSGVAGLLVAAGTAVWLHPAWRPTVATLLVVGAVALLVTTLSPVGSVRRRRLADLTETAALVALPPLAVVATGVLPAVRG